MKDSRNKIFAYEKCVHLPRVDKEYMRYCRTANAVIPFKPSRCSECPLWNGEYQEVGCVYFDIVDEVKIESQKAMERANGLINAGICTEYPEFLSEQQVKEGGMVYEEALQFAALAHKGTYRKGTKVPYIVHPVEVSSIVGRALIEKYGKLSKAEYEIMAAAALHDVVEDTKFTLTDIKERFNSRIASLVGSESENKRPDVPAELSWRIRKEEFLAHLHQAIEEAKLICLGDKLSNIRSLKVDYEKQGDSCFQKFNVKNKKDHEWYYRSIKNELSCFSEYTSYQEFCTLIDEIF